MMTLGPMWGTLRGKVVVQGIQTLKSIGRAARFGGSEGVSQRESGKGTFEPRVERHRVARRHLRFYVSAELTEVAFAEKSTENSRLDSRLSLGNGVARGDWVEEPLSTKSRAAQPRH